MRLVLFGLVLPAVLAAQAPTQQLPAPNASLAAEFSDLTLLRELRDGRVLLFDRKEERLMVGNLSPGTVRDVARKGQGPAEFESIFALLPLAGDTTIAADWTTRWLILVGDSVVRKVLPEHPALQRTGAPLGADRVHVLTRATHRERIDSFNVVLVNRNSGRADTIASLSTAAIRRSGGRGPVFSVARLPLTASESAWLFPDGWTAVVRLDPYRVDWRTPNGTWTLGRQINRAVRLSGAEKAAYLSHKPGYRNATDWPDELPPFEDPPTLLAAPDGNLLIKRLPTLAEPGTRYDVIDRTGTRRSQVVLPTNQHIVGFGVASIYVVATDDDGIQQLGRHPWRPSTRP